jgi:hypothetical protein
VPDTIGGNGLISGRDILAEVDEVPATVDIAADEEDYSSEEGNQNRDDHAEEESGGHKLPVIEVAVHSLVGERHLSLL